MQMHVVLIFTTRRRQISPAKVEFYLLWFHWLEHVDLGGPPAGSDKVPVGPEGHCWFLCNFVPFSLQSNANIYMLVVHVLRQVMLNSVYFLIRDKGTCVCF